VVAGVDAARCVSDLLPVPDLAIIAVPAAAVTGVVAECGTAGIPAAVVISAGFTEHDEAGARLQEQLLATARTHGMRIVGPNCLGVVSTRCGLNATFTDQMFAPGGIAIAAQSGGVGIAIAAESARRGAGVSAFVSMGNKVDVSSNDLLRAWADDVDTTVVMLYLESFGDPVRFARVARAVSRRKPIVAVKGGRTKPRRRGARSHTAAMADDQAVVDALFDHTGVLRVRTLEELVDVSLLFDHRGTIAGSRVAFIGNASGPLILGADTASDHELVVPELSAELRRQISELVPGAAATTNPIDLTSAMTAAQLAAVTALVARSGEVDACVLGIFDIDAAARPTSLAAVPVVGGVPIVVARTGLVERPDEPMPTYPTVDRATVAVAVAARRARWLATIAADDSVAPAISSTDPSALAAARQIVRDAHSTTGWLDPGHTFELISTAGVPVTPWRYVRTDVECTRAAVALDAPYVVKGDVDQLLHKSDDEAVILGLRDAEEVNEAYSDLAERFGDRLRGVVVQSQADAGVEIVVGVVRPPGFGPVVVVGAGGTDAELRHDRAVLIAPVTVAVATRAINGLQLAPLLHGYRGRPVLPVDQLADLVHRVSMLAAAVPELQQLDLNPVIVTPAGCTVVDALAAVTADAMSSGPLRGLRGHRSAVQHDLPGLV
jgi:acyl-CoA synthetase (NDP forming)